MSKNAMRSFLPSVVMATAVSLMMNACQVVETDTVEAGYPALKAVDHLVDPARVAKWMEPFASAGPGELAFTPKSIVKGADTLTIERETAVDIRYKRMSGDKNLSFLISAEPIVERSRSTRFKLSFPTGLLRKWTGGGTLEKETRNNLERLGRYMEDPVAIYGYDVKRITVTDTTFLFSSKEIATERFAEESKALFDMLISEAAKKNVTYNNVRIFHMEEIAKGRRVIYAGIGISRSLETAKNETVKCKKMPFGHNLLAVDYEGPYYNIGRIYQAIEEYRSDNKMTSMAIPFHKYLGDGYGFTDSQTVKLRVCYPVY